MSNNSRRYHPYHRQGSNIPDDGTNTIHTNMNSREYEQEGVSDYDELEQMTMPQNTMYSEDNAGQQLEQQFRYQQQLQHQNQQRQNQQRLQQQQHKLLQRQLQQHQRQQRQQHPHQPHQQQRQKLQNLHEASQSTTLPEPHINAFPSHDTRVNTSFRGSQLQSEGSYTGENGISIDFMRQPRYQTGEVSFQQTNFMDQAWETGIQRNHNAMSNTMTLDQVATESSTEMEGSMHGSNLRNDNIMMPGTISNIQSTDMLETSFNLNSIHGGRSIHGISSHGSNTPFCSHHRSSNYHDNGSMHAVSMHENSIPSFHGSSMHSVSNHGSGSMHGRRLSVTKLQQNYQQRQLKQRNMMIPGISDHDYNMDGSSHSTSSFHSEINNQDSLNFSGSSHFSGWSEAPPHQKMQALKASINNVSTQSLSQSLNNSSNRGRNKVVNTFPNQQQRNIATSNVISQKPYIPDRDAQFNAPQVITIAATKESLSPSVQNQQLESLSQSQRSHYSDLTLNTSFHKDVNESAILSRRGVNEEPVITSRSQQSSVQDAEKSTSTSTLEERVFSIFSSSRKRAPAGLLQQPKSRVPKLPKSSPGMNRSQHGRINLPSVDTSSTAIDTMQADSLLHNSCKLYPHTPSVIESALQFDPDAIRRPVPMVCAANTSCLRRSNSSTSIIKDSSDDMDISVRRASMHSRCSDTTCTEDTDNTVAGRSSQRRSSRQWYAYPINIALKCGAQYDVLELLAKAGPDVVSLPDGPDESNSLGIAIAHGCDVNVIRMLLAINPEAVMICDRHENSSLHIAVRVATTSTNMVSVVYKANPDAISYRNFHGNTPLEVAIRSPHCPEEIVDLLQYLSFSGDDNETLADVDELRNLDVSLR
jgi:hypothetical protein